MGEGHVNTGDREVVTAGRQWQDTSQTDG